MTDWLSMQYFFGILVIIELVIILGIFIYCLYLISEKSGDTAENQFIVFRRHLVDAEVGIGELLLPMLKKAVGALNKVLKKLS